MLRADGLHVSEDHFIMEVVDPATLKPLPPGEEGELVFTTITKQGFPLIRYRTGDISASWKGPAPAAGSSARMRRVSGRVDDMIIVDGVNVFPSQIEDALLKVEGIEPHYRIIVDREGGRRQRSRSRPRSPRTSPTSTRPPRSSGLRRASGPASTRPSASARASASSSAKSIERSEGNKLRRVIDRRQM